MKVAMRAKQRGFWQFAIPAIAAVAGSALSNKSREKSEAANLSAQEAYNAESLAQQREMNEANIAAQREFAQHGIRWKVEDSKAAGLHPLFGAGLSGTTFSPSFQVANRLPPPPKQGDDYSWLSAVGQLLGNFLNQPEARPAQVQAAAAAQGPSQSLTITEHPGGGRTIVAPIQGLESQVQGVGIPEWTDMSGRLIGGKSDDYKKGHIVERPWEAGAFWQRFNFGDKFQVILPKTSEPQEVFEDKPLWFWAMVAKANVKEFGLPWLTQARNQFPSLREVWSGVMQELKSAGILDAVGGAIPDIIRR